MIKLYSDGRCPHSHQTRIVLAEKELPVDVVELEPESLPDDFLQLNPYGKLPTVIDRDIVFFEPSVVNEYLDERYPHPPLKPGSPAERAQMRLAVMQFESELYPMFNNLQDEGKKDEATKSLKDYLKSLDSYFARQQYFIGEQYSLADVALAPILWRLSPSGIDTAKWGNLEGYMDRVFERPAFQRSLSEYEDMLHH